MCGIALCLSACGLFGKSDEAEAPAPKVRAIAADWPGKPVLAFRLPERGVCAPRYELVGTTCVHVAMRARVTPERLQAQLAAYRSGAVSPRIGGGPAPAELPEPTMIDPSDPSSLPPDALTTKRLDAKEAEARRLNDLQSMIDRERARAAGLRPPQRIATPQPTVIPEANAGARGSRSRAQPMEAETMVPDVHPSAAGDSKRLSEMTEGLPPEVLKNVLEEIQRNGGTQLFAPEELEALQRRIDSAELDQPHEQQPSD